MKHRLPIWATCLAMLSLAILACSIGQNAATPAASGTSAPDSGTIISVTSSVPTATLRASGNMLPSGTLILTQLGHAVAQLPNASGQTVSLTSGQFGNQASPDGRYSVKTNQDHSLSLVDFSTSGNVATGTSTPTSSGQAIPQSAGFADPHVTWRPDASGFAFFDFTASPKPGAGAIFYYDISSSQTKTLVAAPAQSGTLNASIAFSPDGTKLAYAIGNAGAEGIGGPDSKLFVLDTGSNQSTPLPAGLFGFTHWLRDSQSFVVRKIDKSGVSQLLVYALSSLNSPKTLTPANTSDFLVDSSPDGKHLVVTTAPKGRGQPVNVAIMNLDGSSRKVLTKFTDPTQSITGLIWANDGIYYSLLSGDNKDTTWRMDLDGSNATQVAQGTLNGIVGIR